MVASISMFSPEDYEADTLLGAGTDPAVGKGSPGLLWVQFFIIYLFL